MSYRRTCARCGQVFFSADRNALYCPKCIKRYGLKATPAPSGPQHEPDLPSPSNAPKPPTRPPRAPGTRPAAPPRPPQIKVLNDAVRAQIQDRFHQLRSQPDLRLRQVHGQIAKDLHVARPLVVQVTAELIEPDPPLSPEQKAAAVERYRAFVSTNTRPLGGRRRTIARDLGVTYGQVVEAVKEWAMVGREAGELSRGRMFEIEKAYFRLLKSGVPYFGVAGRIASEMGMEEWQILRRIDLLHEDPRRVENVSDPTPEQRGAILQAYSEYLNGGEPPTDALHPTIASRVGVANNQVFKVLLVYRNALRDEARSRDQS